MRKGCVHDTVVASRGIERCLSRLSDFHWEFAACCIVLNSERFTIFTYPCRCTHHETVDTGRSGRFRVRPCSHSGQIAEESGKHAPDAARLAVLRAERSRLAQERAGLHVGDHSDVARVRAEYGAMVRAWRAGHQAVDA